jgi:hypothetical protein
MAVEWAADQPWSTGKVGMYGKSYDGATGLLGVTSIRAAWRPSSPRSRSTTSTATSADWKVPAGHRIAVRVTDANEDWWVHAPTFDDVQVVGGSVTLPFLAAERTETIQGDPGTQLEGYLSETVIVPPETLRESVSPDFALPPEQTP